MKSRTNNQLNLNLGWETVSSLETSLRKLQSTQHQSPICHEHLELIIKSTKQLLGILQAMKAQENHYLIMQENYKIMQNRINNHQKTVSELEKTHLERLKSMLQETKILKEHCEKVKKNHMESEQQIRSRSQQVDDQNRQLKHKLKILTESEAQLRKSMGDKEQLIKLLEQKNIKYRDLLRESQESSPVDARMQSLVCSQVGAQVLQFLSPPEIVNMQLLNRECRLYLIKSNSCQIALSRSLIACKNRVIRYYHRHIGHFESMWKKIPEEIVQLTYYRYRIEKQTIGNDISVSLKKAALLFEGKFVDDPEQDDYAFNKAVFIGQNQQQQPAEQRPEQSQAHKEGQFCPEGNNYQQQSAIHRMLQIDPNVVNSYLTDQSAQRVKVHEDINLMHRKIRDTLQLFSADVESTGLFLKNVLKSFSQVFVLSKNLYLQTRNVQALNTFLLRELTSWEKIQIRKDSEIQDLASELEAEKKLRLFFAKKSISSEQKALNLENERLIAEDKLTKQAQKLSKINRCKQILEQNMQEGQQIIKSLQTENRQIKKAYEHGKRKYKQIISELGEVKQIIFKFNLQ